MTKALPTLSDIPLSGKRVLLRAGFDVPIENGVVEDVSRIEALVPTMRFILDAGASLIILTHQGRPKGKPDPAFTVKPLVPLLEKLLSTSVAFAPACTGSETEVASKALKPGHVLLVENLRYDPREEKNDESFAKELAALGDVYVNDAFTNCHRAHASMVGIPKFLPSCMGLQLAKEVEYLSKAIVDPPHPLTLIVSGAKMETKVPVIENFLQRGDAILIGGAIANAFIAAQGCDVAKSLCDKDAVTIAKDILQKKASAVMHVPSDAVVASEMSETASKSNALTSAIPADSAIYDIGTATIETYVSVIENSAMIVWNGPIGLYELANFAEGTKRIAEAVAAATKRGAISIIGGGDTIDFHTRYGLDLSVYTFVSTGGGAMLEFVSGTMLPGLEALAAH